MKTTITLTFALASFLALPSLCQAQSSNKLLTLGTNNILRPNETNFFAVNSNLLNASVAGGSGGGGFSGNPSQFSSAGGTSNIISGVALTNISAQGISNASYSVVVGSQTNSNTLSIFQGNFFDLQDWYGTGGSHAWVDHLANITTLGNMAAASFRDNQGFSTDGLGDVVASNMTANASLTVATNITSSNFFNTPNSYSNALFGYLAGHNAGTGGSNTVFGNYAFQSDTTGSNNLAAGLLALQANTSGSHNVALGFDALASATIASSNIAIGDSAGINCTTNTNNIFIGHRGAVLDNNIIRLGSNQNTTYLVGNVNAASNFAIASGVITQSSGGAGNSFDGGAWTDNGGGGITAVSFAGSGGGLTSLNAANLATGTVPLAQLPVNLQPLTTNNGAGLTNLNPAYMNTYYLSNYGGIDDQMTDNTGALQLAILNAWTNGGGIIKLFAGTNWIKGAFNPVPGQTTTNHTMNCQVYFPAVSLDTQQMVTIVIEGASPPGANESWDQNSGNSSFQSGLEPLSSTGSILMSTNQSGTYTNAVFGTAPVAGYSYGFSGVKVILRNCICRQYQAASNDFWGMEYAGDFRVEDVSYDVGVPAGQVASNAPQQGYTGSAAFRFPVTENWANGIGARHVNVLGACVGMAVSEHFIGEDINFWRCWYPWQIGTASSAVQIAGCDIVSSPYTIDVTGTAVIQANLINVEHDNVWGSNNTNSWMNPVADITGTANDLSGHITVSPATSQVGTDNSWKMGVTQTNLDISYVNSDYSITYPTFSLGTYNIQPYIQDNILMGDNCYYNGANYTRVSANPAEQITMEFGSVLIGAKATGTAGGTFPSMPYMFKVDANGNVALGGTSLSTTFGSYAGATMVVGVTGQTNGGLVLATNGFGSYATNFLSSFTATAWTNTNKFNVTVDFPNGVTNFTLSNSAPYQILNDATAPGLYSRHLGPGWEFTNTSAGCVISAE